MLIHRSYKCTCMHVFSKVALCPCVQVQRQVMLSKSMASATLASASCTYKRKSQGHHTIQLPLAVSTTLKLRRTHPVSTQF